MPFYRYMEVTVYSLLNFLPFMVLAIYPFRQDLRFSPAVTGLGVGINALVHAGIALLKYHTTYNGLLSLACTACHALFLALFIKNHYGKAVFTILVLTNISNFVVVASKCLEGFLFPTLALQHHRWSNSVTMLAMELVVLIPLAFYFDRVYCKALEKKAPTVLWRYLWLIPLTFYAVWFRNFYFSQEGAMTLALRPRHTLFSLVINGGALLVYTMIVKLIEEQDRNEKLREREYHLTMQHAQYGNLQDRVEEARRAKHDLRQHIHVVSAYLKEKKYEELEQYIARYEKTVPDESVSIFYCEHFAVNALLGYFAGYAKIIGCGFNAAVHIPQDVGIPEEVLAVVLGNLLENAMEASLAEGGGAVVSVRGKCDETAVFLKIVNTCHKPPKTDKEGRFLSSKRKGYGIGLQSVREIAEQYDGMMKAHWEDGKFTVSVMLNIPEGT